MLVRFSGLRRLGCPTPVPSVYFERRIESANQGRRLSPAGPSAKYPLAPSRSEKWGIADSICSRLSSSHFDPNRTLATIKYFVRAAPRGIVQASEENYTAAS
jgi:hypothetical protein